MVCIQTQNGKGISTLLALKLPDLHAIFRSSPADYGEEVENYLFLGNEFVKPLKSFNDAAAAEAIGLDPSKSRLDDDFFCFLFTNQSLHSLRTIEWT